MINCERRYGMQHHSFSAPRRRIGPAMFAVAGLLVGCGGSGETETPRAEVTVSVTFDGQPVTEGHVDLQNPESGTGGGAELNAEGQATISGIPLGSYTVTVIPPMPDPAPPEPGQAAPPVKEFPNIPEPYRRTDSSPLKAEIDGSTSELKFELEAS